jgi:hypothetical protein
MQQEQRSGQGGKSQDQGGQGTAAYGRGDEGQSQSNQSQPDRGGSQGQTFPDDDPQQRDVSQEGGITSRVMQQRDEERQFEGNVASSGGEDSDGG